MTTDTHGYVSFEVCTIPVCGMPQRGAKAVCGYCGTTNTVKTGTLKVPDSAREERFIAKKFESIGWKIGKTAKQNRCPKCYAAIRLAAKNRSKEQRMAELNGVSPAAIEAAQASPAIEPHRAITRDDRRIIFAKLNEVYADAATGYSAGWNDERVAADLGVPIAWVTSIRDENLGPEVDPAAELVLEARALIMEARSLVPIAEPVLRQIKEFGERAVRIEQALLDLEARRKH